MEKSDISGLTKFKGEANKLAPLHRVYGMTENEQILAGLLKDAHSWTDLKPLLSKYNTTETETTKKNTKAGKLFELFAKLCFEHDSNFKEEYNIKKAFLYEELPDDLKQKLRIGKIEHGIDLILLSNDDQTIAVQCKFKNNEEVKLNWNSEKLGNFFGFARNANYHIVLSNSSDITDVAKNLTTDFKFLGYSYLKDISPETFQSIHLALTNKTEPPTEKPKPRKYQEEAITAVLNHFKEKDNDRGQLILPCGAGKTLTALWIKEALQARNTLVLVPSLALLRQIKKEWNKSFNEQFIRLNVCSEKDIDSDKNVENDALIVHTYEIPGNVTSDKKVIADFLKQPNNKVVFCTYQSLQAVVDALQLIPSFQFDLILADEAHKTAGFEDQNKFTLVHNPDKVRSARRLYMTATPRIASAELKKHHKERLMYLKDMSNPKVFGKEAYRMTFGTAIDKKILVNYKIIAVGVSDTDLKKYIDKNIVLTKTERIIDYANNYALNIAMEKYNAFHALTFHSRVELAERFAARHPKLITNIHAYSISGTQTTSEREKILDTFKAQPRAVISNARCLTEGVDVPVIDMVYYGDPKNSKIDIVQSAGRALRTGKIIQNGVIVEKEWGFIVVPIFHKDKQTVEEAIDKSQYKNLITVIRSLCDQDEGLAAEINQLAWERETTQPKGTIEFTFSDDETDKVIQFEQIQEKLKKALFNQIIDNLKDPWEIHYKQLEDYFKEHGHSDIQAREKHKGFALGTWAVGQRVEYRNNRLSEREIKLLEKLNFPFEPKNFFPEFIIELKAFHKKYGHTKVVTQSKEYPKLGRTVNKVRGMYTRGKMNKFGNIVDKGRGTLLKSEIDELNKLGFVWTALQDNWDANFSELKKYFKIHGHSDVESTEDQDLYYWCWRQKKRAKRLTEEQKQKFATVNFSYTIRPKTPNTGLPRQPKLNSHNKNWDEMLERLKTFKEQYQTFQIPKKTNEEKQLASWIFTQRISNNNGKLSQDRIDKLNAIQFPWVIGRGRRKIGANATLKKEKINNLSVEKLRKHKHDDRWMEMFDKIKKYTDQYKDFYIPRSPDEYNQLRIWAITQRIAYKSNKLSQERIATLNSIQFPWTIGRGRKKTTRVAQAKKEKIKKFKAEKIKSVDTWDKHYLKLIKYKLDNEDCNVPRNYPDKTFSHWVSRQRNLYKKGQLTKEQIHKLNLLEFQFSNLKKKSEKELWMKTYKKLVIYFNKYGDSSPKINYGDEQLISWVVQQRHRKRKGTLRQEFIDLLEKVKFDWNPERYTGGFKADNETWLLRLQELIKYKKEFKDTNVSQLNKPYYSLARWVNDQRVSFKRKTLSQFRIEKLNELNFIWEIKEAKYEQIFNERFNELVAYHKIHKDYKVPQNCKEFPKLGSWVSQIRHRGTTPERKKRLDDIGFNWKMIKKNGE